MDSVVIIRLSVPGTLAYRDLVLRVVASSCKLVRSHGAETQEASHDDHDAQFDNKVVSAVSEVFNNIAIHGYRNRPAGSVDIEIEMAERQITLRLADTGVSFDPDATAPPDLDALPESRMGLYIARSFMDEVSYRAAEETGRPNVMTLTKRY